MWVIAERIFNLDDTTSQILFHLSHEPSFSLVYRDVTVMSFLFKSACAEVQSDISAFDEETAV